ncbi:type I polyketide synthase [Amycolatopsis anabasis]|uniref:type I polyketide synthase n=1 Tax=Amycolatopsis anabasis TaxID=1840409 RepID=UPI00131DA378|nr:type I polyketide synthase [Amycolatopsis anabasis]
MNRVPDGEPRWRAWLAERLGELLDRPVGEREFDRPLHEFGVSSRDATVLAAEIGELVGRDLPSTLVWSAPTIAELARTLAAGAESVAAADSGPADPGEPVAIVGLACRFPGASTVDEFWSLLAEGESAIGEIPDGRWEQFAPGAADRDLPRHGGFLGDVAGFDAEFFGISPGEAEVMDPQQRLLLEVTWEALSHARIPPESLRGTDCAVFVGLSATEYAQLTMTDLDRIDTFSSTGAAASLAANRVSYALGVHGPSVTVDTACSSSLVAVHQAVRALVDGEASAAVAAGVNVLLSPGITANFELAGLLAGDGRCKPFDADADGITRGEGCGVVVLKRLADAQQAGDRILGVIRGSAVNSDGRSNGIMAPNPVAQQRVLARAYAKAGVPPRTIDYVEAHGTGTLLGDPIEAGALAAVLGANRAPDRPLLLGSVKSNLGHLEGAAGIAGLIKVVLGLWHSQLPRSRNFSTPSPHIDFEAGRLAVVTETTEWPRYSGVARAGVSSFGFGGTNAHVVVEEWPRTSTSRRSPVHRPEVIALSAKSPARLRARARALADWVDDGVTLPELAAAVLHGDDPAPVRAAIPARDHRELRERLRALAEGQPDRSAPTGGGDPVFVFSGYGSQWPAMGRRLLAEEPVFAAAVRDLDGAFAEHAGVELTALLDGTREPDTFATRQLAIFGIQVALAELWKSVGVRPAAVLGHSMGEVAAAVVAGALDPVSGVRVMAHRAVLLEELDIAGAGAMAVVELSPVELGELGERFPEVTVAVFASPTQCTVSGPAGQVAELVSHVDSCGGLARMLPLGAAGHSAAVDPLLGRFRETLGELRPAPATTYCYSSVLDDPRQRPAFDTEYWAANLRRPVRFTQALAAAIADGHRTFLEIAPHPIAHTAIEQTAHSLGVTDLAAVASLRRDLDGTSDGFSGALAQLHVLGHPEALLRRYPDRVVIDLPPPVWEHRRYWVESAPPPRSGHPFLGDRVEVPGTGQHVWPGEVGTAAHPWLAEHAAHGSPILPGGGFVELLLTAAGRLLPRPELREVVLHRILPLADHTEISVSADPRPGDAVTLSVFARSGGDWLRYADATAVAAGVPPVTIREDVSVEVEVPRDGKGFTLHPALGEACVRALVTADDRVWLPTGFGRVSLFGDPRRATRAAASRDTGSAWLLDPDGTVLAAFEGVTMTPVGRSEVPFAPERLAYQAEWVPSELPEKTAGGRDWVLVHAGEVDPRPIAELLAGQGHVAVPVPWARRGELVKVAAEQAALGGVVVLPGSPEEPGAARELVLAVAETVHDLTTVDGEPPRLWLATGKAAVVLDGEPGHPALAALRGLIRVLAFEHPELRASWIDHDDPADLARELTAAAADDEVAWRNGHRYTRILTRATLPAPERPEPIVREGAYLITGGLGGLGLAAARWLAERGATRIVLSGRRGPSDAASVVLGEIQALGADVEVVTGDIAEPGVAVRMVRWATADGTRLRGVLHAAGVLADGAVLSLNPADLAAVWRGKVEGALRLHEACAGIELDWWLAYSSGAALFGSPGQAAYATANAWLDAFAAWRRGQGLPATTIQWGAWAEIGGAAGRDNPILEPMPPEEGMAALAAVLASRRGETGITRMNAASVLDLFPRLAERPFFAMLAERRPDETGPWAGIDALRTLATEDPERAGATIGDHLRSVVAEMMWLDPELLDPHAPLTSLGLDSLLAMRARAAVERDFGTTLPLPMLLRGASLADLADHLVDELRPAGAAAPEPGRRPNGPGTRDLAERWVARAWRQVLGPREVAVDVPFTEIGTDGDAERLGEIVSAELGRPVSAAELLAVPTIAGMADLVRAELEGPGQGPVRLLGGDGQSPAVFLFHAAGSPTAAYRPLVRLLDADVTCYGLERLDDLDTVREKAARYVELIRQRQPEGPYRLGGWSFGGLLAFETAQQLTAAGAEIELLFLIDTILPLRGVEPSPDEALQGRLRKFIAYIEQTYQVDLGLPEQELAALGEDERNEFVMRRLRERVTAMGDAVLTHQQTSYVDARIAERYTPSTYAGPVLLFRAKDPHPLTTTLDPRYLRTDDALGWDEHCPRLEVVRVHGDHITVIDPPHVAVIADRLSALLPHPIRGDETK